MPWPSGNGRCRNKINRLFFLPQLYKKHMEKDKQQALDIKDESFYNLNRNQKIF